MVEPKRVTGLIGRFQDKLPTKASVDQWFSGYAVTTPAVAGSWLTFLYFGAALWAMVSLAFRRYPLFIPPRSRAFVMSCLAFALVILFSSLIHDGAKGIMPGLLAVAAFLAAPLLISRYCASAPAAALQMLVQWAPAGAFLGLAAAVWQAAHINTSIEGGAGNPSVFGFACATVGLISLADANHGSRRSAIIGWSGFAAGMTALLLSQTRVLYPLILLGPLLVAWNRRHLPRGLKATAIATTLIATATVLFLVRSRLAVDLASTGADLSGFGSADSNSSLGIRLALWKGAWPAINQSPWLGQGLLHKMDTVFDNLPDRISYFRANHMHNGWMDALLAAGIPGFAAFTALFVAPLAMVRGRVSSVADQQIRFIVPAVVGAGLLNSLMNTLFAHDLMTVVYLLPLVIAAAATDNRGASSEEGA